MTPSCRSSRATWALIVLSCIAWTAGADEERPEWQLAPRLARGQEFVYQGTIREQSEGRGVQFNKTWKLDIRALVLNVKSNGSSDVAFFTRITAHQVGAKAEGADGVSHVRLELAEVDAQGRLTAPAGVSSSIPLEGISGWEHGFLEEFPRSPVVQNQDWLVAERDRPGRKYHIAGMENLAQGACVKVVGQQLSPDWNLPRGDTTAWRRRDTLLIIPKLGVAQRVIRDLERRDPAHTESTYRLVTDYELESNWKFDGSLFEDRKKEIAQYRAFQEAHNGLLPPNRPQGKEAFQALLGRIDQHVDKHPATPYREALTRLRQRTAELVQNPNLAQPTGGSSKDRLAIGKAAPEFLVDDLKTGKSVSLRTWHGKTLLMVFYHPASDTSAVVLRQMQRLADRLNDSDLAVVGFSMSDEAAAVKRVEASLSLTFPTVSGGSLRQSYEVDATPRVVVVDRGGMVRGAITGWGPEVLPAIEELLAKSLAKPEK